MGGARATKGFYLLRPQYNTQAAAGEVEVRRAASGDAFSSGGGGLAVGRDLEDPFLVLVCLRRCPDRGPANECRYRCRCRIGSPGEH
jgi:hypothetical protein